MREGHAGDLRVGRAERKKTAVAVCGFRSSTGLKVDPKLRPRSPPFELDHRVMSVLGSITLAGKRR